VPGASRSAHISDTLFPLSSISRRYDAGEKPQRESKKPEKETALCKRKKKFHVSLMPWTTALLKLMPSATLGLPLDAHS